MYLGIDIGGTTARVAAFHSLHTDEELGRYEFEVSKKDNPMFKLDLALLHDHCIQLSSLYGRIKGVGLAIAGKVNDERTLVTAAGNLEHWAGIDFQFMLEQELCCRVVLGNDAEAAALAEAHYGKGQDTDFWFVIWGTGVGGCLVRTINGVPLALPGELGHQQVKPNSAIICGCGQYGCLEAFTGSSGIQNRLNKPAAELSSKQWNEVLDWMQIGIHNVVAAQPVPLVVFGGGIANKQPQLLRLLEERLKQSLRITDAPRIQLSAFGESAGTIGALALLQLQ
jgi:glucokinase